MKLVNELIETLKVNKIYNNLTILIHGDHGPRINRERPNSTNVATFTFNDFDMNYSTLFAVKFPGTTGKFNSDSISLTNAFRYYLNTIFNLDLPHDKRGEYFYVINRGSDDLVQVEPIIK